MKRFIILQTFLLCFISVITAETSVKVFLLNGQINEFSVNDNVDEIFGVKTNLYFKNEENIIFEFNHKSPIIKIEGLEALNGLKKISLFMELYEFSNFQSFISPNLDEIYISFGLDKESLESVQNMSNLKILYLNCIEVANITNIDLSKTKLEYIEISYSHLNKIQNLILPRTLKYLNLIGNEDLVIDNNTIENINNNNIILFSDLKIEGVKNQYNGNQKYSFIPKPYSDIGP